MIKAVHSKDTVNSKGRETKIIKLHSQRHTYPHNYKHREAYNSNYSVHRYLIRSFTLLPCFSCIQ